MNRSVQMFSFAILLAVAVFAVTVFTSPATATRSYGLFEDSTMGSVDSFTLIDIGIQTEARIAQRDAYTAQGDAVLTPMFKRDAELRAQLSGLAQNDPMGGQLYQEYQMLNQQIEQQTQQVNAGYQELIAAQIVELYKEVHAATNEVAIENGYSYVFSTRVDSEFSQTDSIQGVTQEVLSRPLVVMPEATDLTELVRVKLGLPTMEEVVAEREAREAAELAAFEAEQAARAEAELSAAEAGGEEGEGAGEENTESTDPMDP